MRVFGFFDLGVFSLSVVGSAWAFAVTLLLGVCVRMTSIVSGWAGGGFAEKAVVPLGVVGDLSLSFPISSQSAAKSGSFPFRNRSDSDGLFFAFESPCRVSTKGSALVDGEGEF
jgi:hypothetical protein